MRDAGVITGAFEIPVPWSDDSTAGHVDLRARRARVRVGSQCGNRCSCFPRYPAARRLALPQLPQRAGARWNVFDERQDETPDLHINTSDTLGLYCRFFYVDQARRRQVIELMRRLRPKRAYREAADRIAAGLGAFNAVHIRRGDFQTDWWAGTGFKRAPFVSGQEIVTNLASRLGRDDTLVICTDDSSHDELFGPIQKHFSLG